MNAITTIANAGQIVITLPAPTIPFCVGVITSTAASAQIAKSSPPRRSPIAIDAGHAAPAIAPAMKTSAMIPKSTSRGKS